MKQVELKVHDRPSTGRGNSRRMRAAGSIPAVLYGASGVRHLAIDNKDFRVLWKQVVGRTALLHLHFDEGDPMFAIIQDSQRDSVSDEFQHVDFLEIQRGQDMTAYIPIVTKGTPLGVRDKAGVLEHPLLEVEVRCRPRNLPEIIEVDVSGMDMADTLTVADLPQLEGVEYLTDAEQAVAIVTGAVIEASAPEESDDEEEEPEAVEAVAASAEGEGEEEEK